MSNGMIAVGNAGNASSLQPHPIKDPLDFISEFVLNHEKPEVALNFVMFSLTQGAKHITYLPAPTIDMLTSQDTESGMTLEKAIAEQDAFKKAASEFLEKIRITYPNETQPA